MSRGARGRKVDDCAVVELVREEGQSRRTTARFLAFGVNGLAVDSDNSVLYVPVSHSPTLSSCH